MPKVCWTCLKYPLLIVIILSSALTIYLNHTGSSFDPIREIQKLKSENRRDDALDLAKFYGTAVRVEKIEQTTPLKEQDGCECEAKPAGYG